MNVRRGLALVGVLAIVSFIAFSRWPGRAPREPRAAEANLSAPADGAPLSAAAREKILRESPEAHLADALNLPDNTLQTDVAIVGSLIAAYRSIHRQHGNPVGDNREIVRSLQGRNPNGVIFLPREHRALNADGELCDRWGTPFFFHAESGTRMEVRSAGPDRTLWTADDVAIRP